MNLISSLANESAQIAVFMHLGLKWFVNWVSRQPSILKARAEHIKHVKEKLEARIELGSQPDIMEGWLKEKEKWVSHIPYLLGSPGTWEKANTDKS